MSDQATARFDAAYVVERADEAIAKAKADYDREFIACIDNRMSRPVFTGHLWWRTWHMPTREEAIERFKGEYSGAYVPNAAASLKIRMDRKTHTPTRLRRLAMALIQSASADQFVTLTADDCRALGIPLGEEVAP